MKKLFSFGMIVMSVIFLIACNSSKTADEATAKVSDSTVTEKPNYPYTPTYSASFEMGDTKQALAVMNLWKDWDNGDLSRSKDLFADSVTIYSRDGSLTQGPRDSVVAESQAYRNMYTAVESRVAAVFPVRSTDKDENWVCIWGTEINTDKKGKIDSIRLQET
jgi:hypothetical protein